jgi:AMP-polyphosphate phosphotransferase
MTEATLLAAPMLKLRADMLRAQTKLLNEKKRPLIILLGGFAGAGKADVAARFSEWMDPRHIRSIAFEGSSGAPDMAEAWKSLPPKGKASVVFWGWYAKPFFGRATGTMNKKAFEQAMEHAADFERLLLADGAVVVKLWLDLTEKEQSKRLAAFEKDKSLSWRASKQDWKENAHYKDYAKARDAILAASSTVESPWHVISGRDEAARDLQAGRAVEQALREAAPLRVTGTATAAEKPPVLGKVDRNASLSKEKAEALIPRLQGRLSKLLREPRFAKRGLVLVFEGSDAAGKGGAIRRVTYALDARQYCAIPIAAPSEEERAYPYLWRFWKNVPPRGKVAIFDRSWYGRVLVERVEKFAAQSDWKRAYREIVSFEEELTQHGLIVLKFWLATTKEEQLVRFNERAKDPFKRFKITDEDFRNRKKWDEYELAADDMFRFTHRPSAPWVLVGANDKDHARVTVLTTILEQLERAL